jgi:hypothetical protein
MKRQLLITVLAFGLSGAALPALADTERAKDDAVFAEAKAREAKANADRAAHEVREAKEHADKAEHEARERKAKEGK